MGDDAESDKLYPQPGETLEGKYEIQRVLGTGAMGAVLRATHLLRKAPVALKFMSPKIMSRKGVVDRFLNEGIAASQIDSDHVVKVLDVSKLPSGVPYLVMEYLEGEDLRELLKREGAPGLDDIPRCVHFALQMLRGLQVAHRAGIVHRDMKPANCFVIKKDGEPDFLKIVDFGISKVEQSDAIDLTQEGSALGTPLYMSPEQARSPKDVDARSDLYGVATIFYEMVSGEPPFVPESGTISELFMMLGTEEPASLVETRGDLPSGLWDVVHKGLAKAPDDRFQNAAEMAEALAAYADERSNHVLKQITVKASTGVSRMPPPPGPPTHVDEERPFHPPSSTLAMSEADASVAVLSHVETPLAHAGTVLDDSRAPGVAGASAASKGDAAPAPVADTQQGTVNTLDALEGQRQAITPLLWAAIAIVVVGGAAIGIALRRTDAPAPAASASVVSEPSASTAPPSTRAPLPRVDAAPSASASTAPSAMPGPHATLSPRPAPSAAPKAQPKPKPGLGDIRPNE